MTTDAADALRGGGHLTLGQALVSPCETCAEAPCCSYLPLHTFTVETLRDVDYVRYLLNFDAIELGINATGTWSAYYRAPCRHLGERGRCTLHGTPAKPHICVQYDPYSCWYRPALTGSGSDTYLRVDRARFEVIGELLRFDDDRRIADLPLWDDLVERLRGDAVGRTCRRRPRAPRRRCLRPVAGGGARPPGRDRASRRRGPVRTWSSTRRARRARRRAARRSSSRCPRRCRRRTSTTCGSRSGSRAWRSLCPTRGGSSPSTRRAATWSTGAARSSAPPSARSGASTSTRGSAGRGRPSTWCPRRWRPASGWRSWRPCSGASPSTTPASPSPSRTADELRAAIESGWASAG